ncbi:MAG: hypothetical protein OXK76_18840 [Gammaproteobacteria bacterium]|nr:hypothetical protein [Gammaproteobacteria bacterium]
MSPCIVVSDSSVLIDLERGCLFEAAFALPFDFCVPDLLYRLELEPYGGNELVARGLQVLELDGDGVAQAARYRQTERAISLSDAFALALHAAQAAHYSRAMRVCVHLPSAKK